MLKHPKTVALVSALCLVMSASSAVTAPLTQKQIQSQIVGKNLQAKRMGMTVHILYKTNGSVTMKMPITSGSGTWQFKGNQICMNLKKGPRRGVTCVTFEHIKGNKFRNSQGIEFTVQE